MNPIKKVNTPKSSKNKNKNGLNYNQLFPQKTSDGSNYYMTRRTSETMNNPNFTPFGNDYAIYTDPNLTYEYGNYRGFDINDDGNIYYNSDQGDYTNIKRAVNGQIPRSELGFARGGYIPTFANGGYANLPQYKFGSWLKEAPSKFGNWYKDHAQGMSGAGMMVGGAILTTTGVGAPIGIGMMASGARLIASDVQTNQARNAAEDQMSAAASAEQKQALMLADQQSQNDMYNLTQSRLNEYNQQQYQQPQQQYSAFSAKNGGFMPSYSGGGFMDGVNNNNGVTYFAKGGTHEQNPHGGIPIGQKGRVEVGEMKVKLSKGEYIFSNRF